LFFFHFERLFFALVSFIERAAKNFRVVAGLAGIHDGRAGVIAFYATGKAAGRPAGCIFGKRYPGGRAVESIVLIQVPIPARKMMYINPDRLADCCNESRDTVSSEASMYTAILSVLSVLASGLIAGVFISALLALEETPRG
jgi:hypothetical protein